MKLCVQVPAQFLDIKGPSGSELLNVPIMVMNWGLTYVTVLKLKLPMCNMLIWHLWLAKKTKTFPNEKKVFLTLNCSFTLSVTSKQRMPHKTIYRCFSSLVFVGTVSDPDLTFFNGWITIYLHTLSWINKLHLFCKKAKLTFPTIFPCYTWKWII